MKFIKAVRYVLGSGCLAVIALSLGAKLWFWLSYHRQVVDSFSWNLKFFGDRVFVFLGFGVPIAVLLFWPALERGYAALKDRLTK